MFCSEYNHQNNHLKEINVTSGRAEKWYWGSRRIQISWNDFLKTMYNYGCNKHFKKAGLSPAKIEVQVDGCCFLAQRKEGKQPELPENQAVWKSDNQGVKD